MRRGALTVMVVALAGCGGDGGGNGGSGGGGAGTGPVEEGVLEIPLEARDGSGTSGTAILQTGVGSAEVTLELTNAGDGARMHVHKGSCDEPSADAPVEEDLGFVTANLGQAILSVTTEEIATGEYYIDVHDAKDPGKIDACGQIPEQ